MVQEGKRREWASEIHRFMGGTGGSAVEVPVEVRF